MSKIDPDIAKFVEAIGAVELRKINTKAIEFLEKLLGKQEARETVEILEEGGGTTAFPLKSRRPNYFVLGKRYLIVKISRSNRPFWGVDKGVIDSFNNLNKDYCLFLLVSSSEGWVFSKEEVVANIRRQEWKLRDADNNYKINCPLPGCNHFPDTEAFRKKIGINEP